MIDLFLSDLMRNNNLNLKYLQLIHYCCKNLCIESVFYMTHTLYNNTYLLYACKNYKTYFLNNDTHFCSI